MTGTEITERDVREWLVARIRQTGQRCYWCGKKIRRPYSEGQLFHPECYDRYLGVVKESRDSEIMKLRLEKEHVEEGY